ncbi:capsular polysaccharide synthesis protein [Niallia oryzisoli]|uniref:Capsular polysaccharide synthesis protein n=1 Tax=Niallia oryzisoli TaxID=1737571 RepID=A0ABZ2CC73_9BACI
MNTPIKIPKIIHYCWFGGKEKPELVKKCIESWKQNLRDYEIVEWNEQNFNVNCNDYVRQSYEAGKFAFVSDYARVHALYHIGGIYLDTDVEVFKPFDNLLHHESFWGFEQENFIATSTIGAAKGNKLIKQFLVSYSDKKFLHEDGSFNELTNVAIITKMLEGLGMKPDGKYQEIDGLGVFYPQTYFSPFDYINCRSFKTDETYAMHYFYKSWLPPKARMKGYVKKTVASVIGGNNIAKLRKIVSRT